MGNVWMYFSVEIPRILHRLVTENVRFERTDILREKRTDMISPLRSFVTSRNSFKETYVVGNEWFKLNLSICS